MASKVTFLLITMIMIQERIAPVPPTMDDVTYDDNIPVNPTFRILKGTPAIPRDFPYVVYARSDPKKNIPDVNGHICSGSILTAKWVISAAHCYRVYAHYNVTLDQVETVVFAGTINVNVSTPYTQHRKSIRHVLLELDPSKHFDELLNNDLVLIELKMGFKLNEYVAVSPLASTYPYGRTMNCIAVGFGRTYVPDDKNEPLWNTVLFSTKGTLDGRSDSCKQRAMDSGYGHIRDWSTAHLCMDPLDPTSTPCNGDSGGPLVCEGLVTGISCARLNSNAEVLADCGIPGNYHIYMYIGFYEKWIRTYVSDLLPGKPLVGVERKKKYRSINTKNGDGKESKSNKSTGDSTTAQPSTVTIVLTNTLLSLAFFN